LSIIWHNKGFTLIELLIALAILVLLSGALYGTYFTLMKGRESAVIRMEPLRDVRATLDQMRRELSSALYNKENKRLHFVVEDRDTFGKPSSILDFTAVTAPLSGTAPSSDLASIRYEAVEKDGKLLLTREEKDVYLTATPVPYPQMETIQGFLVECYNGSTWVKSWDTSLNNGLPQAVRITFMLQEGDQDRNFSAIAVPRQMRRM
jgi:general secretion pathway protein J